MPPTAVSKFEDGSSSTGASNNTIRIYNYVDDIDLSDEFEVRETVSELRGLLQTLGAIEEIRVMVATSEHAEISAFAAVTFSTELSATNAISVLCGLVCGGRALEASLDTATIDKTGILTHREATDSHATVSAISSSAVNISPTVALCLYNMVSADTLDDEDEVQEVLGDVKELCQVFGDFHSVWIERREAAKQGQSSSLLRHNTAAATALP